METTLQNKRQSEGDRIKLKKIIRDYLVLMKGCLEKKAFDSFEIFAEEAKEGIKILKEENIENNKVEYQKYDKAYNALMKKYTI